MKNYKENILRLATKLRHIYLYSDSQPTEITLAVCLVVLSPIVTILEIGWMPIYNLVCIGFGLFQLYCIANEDIKCRMRAALLSMSAYVSTFLMYTIKGTIFVSPTHWGWFVLAFSAWGVVRRLNTEYLHRKTREE